MSIIFQAALLGLVLYSLLLVVAVPVLYSSAVDSGTSKTLILTGSIAWLIYVVVVGLLSALL
ncbi:MAG: photosystem II reaction center protein PsbZ [Cyanobacteria bacterium J06639_1]